VVANLKAEHARLTETHDLEQASLIEDIEALRTSYKELEKLYADQTTLYEALRTEQESLKTES
jgi:hypothetical protein